jgi:hypothetical protein
MCIIQQNMNSPGTFTSPFQDEAVKRAGWWWWTRGYIPQQDRGRQALRTGPVSASRREACLKLIAEALT